ncbi:hypothetical protein BGW80DRAFT_1334452 [Lactifluus volemus]|nr:hypothetical protein BGW80DRAFT_1334452 [Lactifluus volemus]
MAPEEPSTPSLGRYGHIPPSDNPGLIKPVSYDHIRLMALEHSTPLSWGLIRTAKMAKPIYALLGTAMTGHLPDHCTPSMGSSAEVNAQSQDEIVVKLKEDPQAHPSESHLFPLSKQSTPTLHCPPPATQPKETKRGTEPAP